ncbi:CBN-GLB-30 protein [Caenorhabditis brenneri]|uniref:CBN-GLB-30 protein n=1 Tax=Caenorhabditis brenneri TaxID=135651 RepID=G0NBS4_CAEBE|nr:CBN-GLB-30 protein [Caenorhabditis brenneri]
MESLSHLTPIDREILNKSWAIVSKDMQQVAVNIFQMIFEQAPDAKLMFSFMMKDYKEDKKSNEFIFHAVRFLQVIESTMTHLDDPSQLDAVFLNLGKIHAKHEEQLGFRFSKHKEMSFAEIDSAIILWREVLRFIIDRMKVGYSESGAIRKSNKQAINGQHSISAEDSGLSSGLSVETKQDLTQVKILSTPSKIYKHASPNRMASRHSVAVIRTNGTATTTDATPTSTTCNILKTLASISPKCVRRRLSLSPAPRSHV